MSRKRTPEVTLWKSIKEAEAQQDVDDVLSMSDDELDAFLAAHGGDPAQIRAAGPALAKELEDGRRRLAWQDEAAEKLAAEQATFDAMAKAPREKLSREELLARIESARRDPRFASPVQVLFRNRKQEAATDEELAEILFEIEMLAKMEEE